MRDSIKIEGTEVKTEKEGRIKTESGGEGVSWEDSRGGEGDTGCEADTPGREIRGDRLKCKWFGYAPSKSAL